MSLYNVKTDPSAAVPRFNGTDAVIVQANSTAEAKALAKANQDGDSDALWAAATVQALDTAVSALTGWSFTVHVNTATAVNVTVVGDSDDTLDDIMAKMVTGLLTGVGSVGTAIGGTAHSAYNTGTNVLTVSSIADGIGDKTITVTVTPPTGLFPANYVWAQADAVASKVDTGIAGAVLTVTFSTTWVAPGRIAAVKQ